MISTEFFFFDTFQVHVLASVMDLQRLQQLLANMPGGGQRGPAADAPAPDTAEKIQISSLSLLKMLKHGKFASLCNCIMLTH